MNPNENSKEDGTQKRELPTWSKSAKWTIGLVWAVFFLSIISDHKTLSLMGLLGVIVPCEGFGCMGQGVMYLALSFVVIPLAITVLALFKSEPRLGWASRTGRSFLLLVLVLVSALIAVGIKKQVEEIKNEQLTVEYKKDKAKEWEGMGIDKAQVLQEDGILSPQRPLSILNSLNKNYIKQQFPGYPSLLEELSPLNSTRGQKVSLQVRVKKEWLLEKEDALGVNIKATYFKDQKRRDTQIGFAKSVECLSSGVCIAVLSLDNWPQEFPEEFLVSAEGKGRVFDAASFTQKSP